MCSSGWTPFFGYPTIPETLWLLSLKEGNGESMKLVGRSYLEKIQPLPAYSSPSSQHLSNHLDLQTR